MKQRDQGIDQYFTSEVILQQYKPFDKKVKEVDYNIFCHLKILYKVY